MKAFRQSAPIRRQTGVALAGLVRGALFGFVLGLLLSLLAGSWVWLEMRANVGLLIPGMALACRGMGTPVSVSVLCTASIAFIRRLCHPLRIRSGRPAGPPRLFLSPRASSAGHEPGRRKRRSGPHSDRGKCVHVSGGPDTDGRLSSMAAPGLISIPITHASPSRIAPCFDTPCVDKISLT